MIGDFHLRGLLTIVMIALPCAKAIFLGDRFPARHDIADRLWFCERSNANNDNNNNSNNNSNNNFNNNNNNNNANNNNRYY